MILDKATASERKVGIPSSCSHLHCLSCIQRLRCAKQLENPVVESCPECCVISELVTSSVCWVKAQNKKNKLTDIFKQEAWGEGVYKYIEQGSRIGEAGPLECPYPHHPHHHACPDGQLAACPGNL